MATPLTLSTDSRDDGSLVLRAVGELDLSNINSFTEALNNAVKSVPDHDLSVDLTIDLSGIEYLDSGAISVLFDHADGIRIVVNPILMPVLKVSGLTAVARIEPATQ